MATTIQRIVQILIMLICCLYCFNSKRLIFTWNMPVKKISARYFYRSKKIYDQINVFFSALLMYLTQELKHRKKYRIQFWKQQK